MTVLTSAAVSVGLSSLYWWLAVKVNTPAARLIVVFGDPSPHEITTVCGSIPSSSENDPLRTAESFSLIAPGAMVKVFMIGASFTLVTVTFTVAVSVCPALFVPLSLMV